MKRVPSAEVRRRSRPPAEPPAIGVMGGRESLSTHMRWHLTEAPACRQAVVMWRPAGRRRPRWERTAVLEEPLGPGVQHALPVGERRLGEFAVRWWLVVEPVRGEKVTR